MLERIPCIRSTTSHRSRFQERGIRTLESVCKAAHRGRQRLWGSWRAWRAQMRIDYREIRSRRLMILKSFSAPSGMFCAPDSHRANVRGETSTCRAAFASDKPRDLRSALSSDPVIENNQRHTSAYLSGPSRIPPSQHQSMPDRSLLYWKADSCESAIHYVYPRPSAPRTARPNRTASAQCQGSRASL